MGGPHPRAQAEQGGTRSLGKAVLAGRWQWVEVAAGLAAEESLRLGAAGPGRSWILLLASGQPLRECVYGQSGGLERMGPTQCLKPARRRERRVRQSLPSPIASVI